MSAPQLRPPGQSAGRHFDPMWFQEIEGGLAFYPRGAWGGPGYLVDEATRSRIESFLVGWQVLGGLLLGPVFLVAFLGTHHVLVIAAAFAAAIVVGGAGYALLRRMVADRPRTDIPLPWGVIKAQRARALPRRTLILGVPACLVLVFVGTAKLTGSWDDLLDTFPQVPNAVSAGALFLLLGGLGLVNFIDALRIRARPASPDSPGRPA